MKKNFPLRIALTVFILIISFVAFPIGNVSAEIADGSYQINYEMKESGSNSTSIADGYFSKPATLTVKNGVQHIQLTVTSSSMIKSLSAPSGAVTVVSENKGNETRVVKFKVDGDLSQPVNMTMGIVVPDLYDTSHIARAVFDVSGLNASSPEVNKENVSDNEAPGIAKSEEKSDLENDASSIAKTEDNPPTGDSTSIALYIMLLLGSSVAGIAIWRSRTAKD